MNVKRLILTLLLLCPWVNYASAQLLETKVEMGISRDSIMIGDTLQLFVDVEKDMATEISIPTFKDNMLADKIEIVAVPTIDTTLFEGRKVKFRLGYTITSFDAGGYKLDSFPMLLGTSAPFDTIFARSGGDILSVGTYEIDTTKDRPVDIKAVMDAPYSWAEFKTDVADNWMWFALGLLGAGAIACGTWWFINHRKQQIENSKPLPAHVVAINSLEKIRDEKLWQSGHIKKYFSEITDTLRVYIDGRYEINAMEMTSAEIIAELKKLDTEQKLMSSMKNLFEIADLAKFAKMVPEAEDCETAYFDAYYFVEQTKLVIIEETKGEL